MYFKMICLSNNIQVEYIVNVCTHSNRSWSGTMCWVSAGSCCIHWSNHVFIQKESGEKIKPKYVG